ncbi:MAG: histidine phosphatase family protein [Candidatus Spechtbacterales bacterium]|nr:histidine phosphatase family protein [Candidatus Spechtbacterales bacterium]
MRLRELKGILTIRHAQSELNAAHKTQREELDYKNFEGLYKLDPTHPMALSKARLLKDKHRPEVSDPGADITEQGIRQSFDTGIAMQTEARQGILAVPDIIYTSPYKRAISTLKHIQNAWPDIREAKVIKDERLREQEVGLVQNYGDYFTFWALNPEQQELFTSHGLYWYRFPNGESVPDVRLRVSSWLHDMRHSHGKKNILVISHFNTLLSLRAEVENWQAEDWLRAERKTKKINCAVSEYKCSKQSIISQSRLEIIRYNKQLW